MEQMSLPSVRTLKVLLIDDDPLFSEILMIRLQKSEQPAFAVFRVNSLKAALRELNMRVYDTVLLDLGLPDSKGIETIDSIHELKPDIPVVVITGQKDEAVQLDALRSGAQDYIVKGEDDGRALVRILQYAVERNRINLRLEEMTNELVRVNKRLENLSFLDPLTELFNRRGLQHALSRELKWVERGFIHPIVIMVDLDNFKAVNDALGYGVGDLVLREISKKLKGRVRVTDYVARVGGDEFLIVLPNTRLAEGMRVAQQVRLAVTDALIYLPTGKPVKVTASLGIGPVTKETPSIDELIGSISPLLRTSKETGKNRVSCDNGKAKEPWTDDRFDKACSELRKGKGIYILKQPIRKLSDGTIRGYEFLSRSTIPGFSEPDVFFRIALEQHMLTLVDHHCFRACVETSRTIPAGLQCHFNLFPSTIIEVTSKHLFDVFERAPAANRYCIEISEQQITGDPSNLADFAAACKKKEICVGMDDIGFGHSCLESLIILEPDFVKIDKNYIKGIAHDKTRVHQLKRMLNVAESLNTEVIAEGIEQENDLLVLKDLGVEYGQGFFIGKPA